jgi:uncharacterized protein
MMQRFIVAGTVCLTLLAGCAGSPRVSYYTLAAAPSVAAPAAGAPASGKGEPSVVVGPVSIPDVVDRPQLVVRVAQNRVEVLESQRWAEPLKGGIARVLAQDLGQLLGSSRVYSYQELTGATAESRVLVDLVRFDSVPGDSVTIEADWSIRKTGATAIHGHSVIREQATGAGYDPLVAAYSRALMALSAELAKAIQSGAAGK